MPDYLVVEDVAQEAGISTSRFVKFMEVHIRQVETSGKMISEETLRFRIEKNFGDVNDDVYNVIVQELELVLEK